MLRRFGAVGYGFGGSTVSVVVTTVAGVDWIIVGGLVIGDRSILETEVITAAIIEAMAVR
jgi:hypothetical protein